MTSQSRRRHLTFLCLAGLATGCEKATTGNVSDSSFSLQLVAEGKGEEVDIGLPFVVSSGPGGLLYVGSQKISALPMILDSTATFVRTLGRRGEGPGETTNVLNLYPRGDSVVVGDQRRATSLYGPDGHFIRMLPRVVGWIGKVSLLRGDTMLLAEPIASEERFGLPLHLFAPNGDTARSFGREDRSFDPRRTMAMFRVVTLESDSTFWTGRVDRYELQRWHIGGELLSTITQERPWFAPQTKDWDGSPAVPMPSRIRGIYLDGDGHLMVMLERARADRPVAPDANGREPTGHSAMSAQLDHVEQLIEVIDVRTGRLLGTILSPGQYLLDFVDDGRIIGLKSGSNGEELPMVYRVVHPTTKH